MPSRVVTTILLFTVLAGSSMAVAQDQNSLAAASNQAARQQLINILVRDLNELIPGDYAKDSDQQTMLNEIANGYISRDQATVERRLGELEASDSKVPPRELLLAGMAFATNNASGGSVLLERGALTHKNHPGFALAFARLALLQNRYFDSVALTDKAMVVNRNSELSEELKRHYEIASISLMTIIEIRRTEFASAEKFARQWERLAPQDDKMLLASAEISFNRSKLDSCVGYLDRRSETKKQEIPTEVVVGKWFQNSGDNASHEKWISEAFTKHPNNKLAQIEYSAILLRKENFKDALAVVQKYEQTFGETPDSKLVKGRVAFSSQDYETAGKIFSDLFRRQPNNFENAYLNILAILENSDAETRKQAIPMAQRAIQTFPNNQLAVAVMGWTFLKTGSVEAGGDLIKKAANMGRSLPDTAYFLAALMKMEGRDIQAKVILEPIISTPDIFLFRSRAKQLLESLNSSESLPDPGSNN